MKNPLASMVAAQVVPARTKAAMASAVSGHAGGDRASVRVGAGWPEDEPGVCPV